MAQETTKETIESLTKVNRGGLVRKLGKLQRASLAFEVETYCHENDPAQASDSDQNNMADMNDLFFFSDDFDAVLDILEIDEELEE